MISMKPVDIPPSSQVHGAASEGCRTDTLRSNARREIDGSVGSHRISGDVCHWSQTTAASLFCRGHDRRIWHRGFWVWQCGGWMVISVVVTDMASWWPRPLSMAADSVALVIWLPDGRK